MSQKRIPKPIVKLLFAILIVYALVSGTVLSLRVAFAVDAPIVVVKGPSMNPTLYDGDMLVVRGVASGDQIEVGSIIIFHKWDDWGTLIVHRVISRFIVNNVLYFQTKGDNNQTNYVPDPVISADRVVGVVLWKIPTPIVSGIILFTQSLTGKLLLIIVIVFTMINMFYGRKDKS